jgi:hypothetical protein
MLRTPEETPPPSRQQATPAPEQNGTDFRYAVEFSKYGRTPATTARPSWGQPWKHYPARFAVSNCPTRSARLAVIGTPGTNSLRSESLRGESLPGPIGTVAARLDEQYGQRIGDVKPVPVVHRHFPSTGQGRHTGGMTEVDALVQAHFSAESPHVMGWIWALAVVGSLIGAGAIS